MDSITPAHRFEVIKFIAWELQTKVDGLQTTVGGLQTTVNGLVRELPRIVAKAVREALPKRRGKH